MVAQLRGAAEGGAPPEADHLHDRPARLEDDPQRAAREAVARTFSGGVAHQVNNPLAVVMANTSFAIAQLADLIAELQRAPLTRDELRLALGEAIAALHESQESAERIRKLVLELRSLAAPRLRTRELLDLREVLRVTTASAGLEPPEPGAPVIVSGDPDLLARVFTALVRNATQAITSGGSVTVRCCVEGERVHVDVEDDGEGIRPDHRPHVFDPFFTTRAPGQALGLGLPLAWAGVRAHGGELFLFSERGEGTRARVTLPLAPIR